MFLNFAAGYDSPMGSLKLLSDGESLTGLYIEKTVEEKAPELPVFVKARAWLDGYFRGEDGVIDFPMKLVGTPFQQLVWEMLLEIPYGSTRTYGELAKEAAKKLGKEKMSAQAVGQAVGRNPISILVPCHRCIGTKGWLTGYSGGMEYKIWLLRHEGRQIENNRVL